MIVAREEDDASHAVVARAGAGGERPCLVSVQRPGVIAAMSAGLAAASADIIALTDDDAIPRPDWLARLEQHFALDPNIGGVGGRDLLPGRSDTAHDVGRVQWHGRVIGNHHAGVGIPREVDVLKGVNAAYRAEALQQVGFDQRLLGSGAQVHWELALGLTLRRAGWRLVYDPTVLVDHYPADRFDEDQRSEFSAAAVRHMVANETLILLEHLPPVRRAVYLAWAVLAGTGAAPGVAAWGRAKLSGDRTATPRAVAALRGRTDGVRLFRMAAPPRAT